MQPPVLTEVALVAAPSRDLELVLNWAHGVWPGVPENPTLLSLGVIVAVLVLVTATSLYVTGGDRRGEEHPEHQTGHVAHPGGIPHFLSAAPDAADESRPRGPDHRG